MTKDATIHVKACPKCQNRCANNQPREGRLQQPETLTRTLECVGIDYMKMSKSRNGNQYVIVAIDRHSKWVEAKAVPQNNAENAAKFLMENWILRHGAPEILLSDQGKEFCNEILADVNKWGRTRHIHTSGYHPHPQSNGITERTDWTLLNVLAEYINQGHDDWDDLLLGSVYSYSVSIHETTGVPPYLVMLGRMPRTLLHSSLLAGERWNDPQSISQMRKLAKKVDTLIQTQRRQNTKAIHFCQRIVQLALPQIRRQKESDERAEPEADKLRV